MIEMAISEHFGHTETFGIYRMTQGDCRLLETREVDHTCLGQHSSLSAMEGILETITDCHAVFVAKTGDGPTAKPSAKGLRAVSGYGGEAIEESLLDYARRDAAGEEPA
ncbi:MAG: dinitrogenase iron-molybdenum cofactor biosynthesis protein [Methylococcaceae bacterium]|nr:dinitrogenase iron-molybdenum cofactor biosynthesis protein [Methylococcaceae bacterium]